MRRLVLPLIFLGLAAGTALVLRFAAPPSPERALAATFGNLRKAEHLSGIASVAMLLPHTDGPAAADDRKPLALRGAFRLDVPLEGRPSGEAAFRAVDADGADGILLDLRLLADGMTYFKAENLPAGMIGSVSLADIGGAWWSLDAETLGAALSAETPGAGAIGAADWQRLRDLVLGGSMFVTDGAAVRERIGDINAYRITLGVTRDGAQAFAKELRAAILGRPLGAEEAATVAESAGKRAVRVTAWIDPKAGRLLQAQIDLDAADGTGAMQSVLLEALDTTTAADVKAPEGAKPFDAVIVKLLPAKPR